MIDRSKIAGAVYGAALGDALGAPTEFMKLKEIHRRFGREGDRRLPRPALFTDDTQMTIAVARALDTVEELHPHELARTLRTEFVRWARVDPPRAPGITCLTAIKKLERRVRWQDATVVRSKGCGANMRVVPTAFIENSRAALGASQLQAAMTHGHPTALAATALTALAVRWAASAETLSDLPERLLAHAWWRIDTHVTYPTDWLGKLNTRRWPSGGWSPDTVIGWVEAGNAVHRAVSALALRRTPRDVCAVTGAGWTADDALATSLYFAVRYADDPVRAVSEASRTSGDSDSLASITGAIVGAFHGEEAWPLEWRRAIERRRDLEYAIDVTHGLS